MKVLIDTNIILDALLGRDPFYEASNNVIKICVQKKADGYIAAHTITNIFYILRKYYNNEECRDILLNLFDIFKIEQIDSNKLKTALLNFSFKDFEDCLQEICAVNTGADYIVTRNTKDFKNSRVKSIEPSDFCELEVFR